MRVLIDTNIILDILLNRKEFRELSSAVLKRLVERQGCGFVAATTLTNIYFIVRRATGSTHNAMMAVDKTLQWCEVAPINRGVLIRARSSGMRDFEDAVQAAAAQDCSIDIIVTRDKAGFSNSSVHAYSPEEFLEKLI